MAFVNGGPVVSSPSNWSSIPNELLVLVFGFLGPKDRLTCSGVCHHWRRVFRADAFGGALHLDPTNDFMHFYLVELHGYATRRLGIFELSLCKTIQLLNRASQRFLRHNFRSLVLAGDETSGAFMEGRQPHEFSSNEVESFILPLLASFFAKRSCKNEDNLMDKHDPVYHDSTDEKEESGFQLEHLSFINLRFVSGDDLHHQATLWSSLKRHSGRSLRSLDLIYFTNYMYFPRELFNFDSLEQLCLSTNHIHATRLDGFANLPNLNHLLVYVGQRPSRAADPFSVDEEAWRAFQGAKPTTRLSFILKTPREVRDNVPRGVRVHGLEILHVDRNFDAIKHFREIVSATEHLALIHVTITRTESLLDFFDDLLSQKPPLKGFSFSPFTASGSPVTPNPAKIPLSTVQYGGRHPGEFYVELAKRLARLPELHQFIYSTNHVEFCGPHSTMSHGTATTTCHFSRRDCTSCQARPDDAIPLLCSVSSPSGFSRLMAATLPPRTLRTMNSEAFMAKSVFWRTDPKVLSRLRSSKPPKRARISDELSDFEDDWGN